MTDEDDSVSSMMLTDNNPEISTNVPIIQLVVCGYRININKPCNIYNDLQEEEGSEEGSSEEDSDDDDVPPEFDEREGYGSGTTACVAVIQEGVITVANVGEFIICPLPPPLKCHSYNLTSLNFAQFNRLIIS